MKNIFAAIFAATALLCIFAAPAEAQLYGTATLSTNIVPPIMPAAATSNMNNFLIDTRANRYVYLEICASNSGATNMVLTVNFVKSHDASVSETITSGTLVCTVTNGTLSRAGTNIDVGAAGYLIGTNISSGSASGVLSNIVLRYSLKPGL